MTTQIYLGNPNQSIVKFIKDHYTPLTFTSTGDTKILFGKCISRWDDTVGREIMVPVDSQPTDGVKLEYSVNNEEWSNYSLANIIELSDGQIVRFRATDAGNSTINVGMSSIWDGVYAFSVSGTGTVAASGNIQSLLDKTCQRMDVPADCYCYMFYGCSALTAAPALPATTLADSCYSNMFSGCSSLTQAPALPATTLADSCYSNMFYQCSALTQAPALPATTLADWCYNGMFSYCSALTTAPALPATTLADSCYSNMFHQCSALTQAPALPATTLADWCYYYMFYNSGIFEFTVDMTACTSIPSLPSSELFNSSNKPYKVLVPASLYDDWIEYSNWSIIASNIQAV